MTESRRLALATGASSGIGLELASNSLNMSTICWINAEDGELDTVAVQLGSSGVSVQPIRADLRTVEGVERLWEQVAATGRALDVAALNAGVGEGGPFRETDLSAELEIIDVNVRSTAQLAKRVLRVMAARDEGKVLITSSIASTMPGSFQAVYNASKSFLQSFAEALQNELKDTGITITSLMPGPTKTNFFDRAHMDDTKVGQMSKDDPAQVAKQGFEALMKDKETITASSMKTKTQAVVNKVLPDKVKAAAHRQMAEPGSGDE
jgi:short-subunit dehydrogenase